MTTRYGKDVFTRVQLRAELFDMNKHADGPWEPVVEWSESLKVAQIAHDVEAELDLHLPGDGKRFDVGAAMAKLLTAAVRVIP